MAVTMLGKPVAEQNINKAKENLEHYMREYAAPKLCLGYYQDSPYVHSLKRLAKEVGIEVKEFHILNQKALTAFYYDWAGRRPFIFVRPYPPDCEDEVPFYIQQNMDYGSYEGLAGLSLGGDLIIPPPTAKSVMDILSYYNYDWRLEGGTVLIVGRQPNIGLPLSMMFKKEDATVITCHSKTPREKILQLASLCDVVVSCAGNLEIFKGWTAKKRQIIVDVGWNDVDGKPLGDFALADLSDCEAYTPVPGGVSAVTPSNTILNVTRYALYVR